MDKRLKKDAEDLALLLNSSLKEGLLYLDNIDNLPTSVVNREPQKLKLGVEGKGGAVVLDEFISRYKQLMVASTGPRYWGFVTGGATPAALMGDILASIFDQNTQTSKGYGDVSAMLEFETIDLLLDLFDLPKDFLGGFVTGATLSNFTCLGVARQWVGKRLGTDMAKDGVNGSIPVLAATPHSSSLKALAMLGLGSSNIQLIKTIDPTREAIDTGELEKVIQLLNGKAFILISSAATVNTADFDDFLKISALKKKYDFWWHIDAAFGGFAAVSPLYAHLLDGWGNADSITIDGHKWLNVPYENAFFFVKEKHKYLQVETFQNSNAPYLGNPLDNFNYLNFLPENSRRFKSLPAWFTLQAYGKEGYREIIERNIQCANKLGDFIKNSPWFELLAPVRLNTVCFSLRQDFHPGNIQSFLNILNERAKVFMAPTVFNKRNGIRAALVNWRTSLSDVSIVQEELIQSYQQFRKMSP